MYNQVKPELIKFNINKEFEIFDQYEMILGGITNNLNLGCV